MNLHDGNIGKAYTKLQAWRESHSLVLLVYKITEKFPREEVFGLTSQLRRAVVSVAANIVEGYARGTTKEYSQFLSISLGSLSEVEYYVFLSKELHYISNETFDTIEKQRALVGRLLYGLRQSLKRKNNLL